MKVNDFNPQWKPQGYQLKIRDGRLRNIGYAGRYLSLQDIFKEREIAKFPFPEHLVDVPQEVFDYLDDLSKQ
ncbi:hypothetical protein [Planktothrix agardhii]|jgi:hypothetical protein|uniref:hypothetical protein n=1 Tax=Planktothrix agardhii TaxID=1160 RepID=UPI0020B44085|nr:hypothetical protein [Planktothrix agardhii]CAD5954712.1 hypothetical protein PCC7811_02770 [Planktothrix agardhii]